MSAFVLDTRLAADTIALGEGPLSRVLLMNDARFPWLILVPRRPALVELTDLTQSERITLMEEIAAVSEALSARAGADKLNIGALGNIVRQLHVHIVARKFSDAAWPGPVWGFGARHSYEQTAAKVFAGQLVEALVGILTD